jgi:hypothetical protein
MRIIVWTSVALDRLRLRRRLRQLAREREIFEAHVRGTLVLQRLLGLM